MIKIADLKSGSKKVPLPTILRCLISSLLVVCLAGCAAQPQPTPQPIPSLPITLTYLGNSCIQITSLDGTSIISDPFALGAKPQGTADLPDDLTANAVTVSHIHPDHNNSAVVGGEPQVLTEPGTYQIGDITVTGYLGWEGSPSGPNQDMRNIIFVIKTNGVKIVHLGDSGIVTDPDVLAAISDADVVLVNIDGYVIAEDQILPFMDQIKARTVLLAHYTLEGKRVWNGAPTAEDFVSEFASAESILRSGNTLEVTAGMPEQIAILRPPLSIK